MSDKLEEITEEEFLNNIEDSINTLSNEQKELYKLYYKYLVDKDKYVMKYYLKNDTELCYTKQKLHVGFEYGRKK